MNTGVLGTKDLNHLAYDVVEPPSERNEDLTSFLFVAMVNGTKDEKVGGQSGGGQKSGM